MDQHLIERKSKREVRYNSICPAYAVNFPILYPSYCTRMCVRGSRRLARLPNSFHLVDLNLTASQTTQRDKAALNLHSPKGGLLYRQREMPLCM